MIRLFEERILSLKNTRWFLFVVFISLTLFGLLMIYESSSLYALQSTGDSAYYFKRQFIFFIIALFCFFTTLLFEAYVF